MPELHELTFDDILRAGLRVPLQDRKPAPETDEEPESDEE